ncbi:MAG TPA: ferrochelatase, partial [Thermomonas sp.]|nr:ferrochelatase [Thermomonas sp.]
MRDQTSMPTLVLVNLGTPAAASAAAVHTYLLEFLSDRRVVQLPHWLWLPLLRKVILPRRSPVVAHKYAEIWLPGGSPLAVHTGQLAHAVQQRLPQWKVLHAMRYGAPSLAVTLQQLQAEGTSRVRVLPLYPQYSTTTTASVADAVALHAHGMQVHMLHDYHADAGWAQAIAASIHAHWAAHGRAEKLVLSFHGIPQRL